MNRRYRQENRRRYFNSLGLLPELVVTADLVHGRTAVSVDDAAAGEMVTGDALATSSHGLVLSATSADCFLIYFFDPRRRTAGIAHAGWRGAVSGIIPSTLELLRSRYRSRSEDIMIGIAPGIRKCHFEISPADIGNFYAYSQAIETREGKTYVDLPAIIKEQLLAGNIPPQNIVADETCTHCAQDRYFSYRRDKPEEVEVMAGYIALR